MYIFFRLLINICKNIVYWTFPKNYETN